MLPEDRRPGDSLHQLLERLNARLGAQQVLQWQAHADHRPEQMQTWQAISNATQLIASCAINTRAITGKDKNTAMSAAMQTNPHNKAFYPTWLLASPLKLAVHQQRPHYQGPLTLLAGPQRLEAGWWDAGGCALRDYFLAHGEQAGLLWIYRERLLRAPSQPDADWYLHGFFS